MRVAARSRREDFFRWTSPPVVGFLTAEDEPAGSWERISCVEPTSDSEPPGSATDVDDRVVSMSFAGVNSLGTSNALLFGS